MPSEAGKVRSAIGEARDNFAFIFDERVLLTITDDLPALDTPLVQMAAALDQAP